MNFKKRRVVCPAWWQLGALIHFAATFFWDKLIFRTDDYSLNLEILNNTISFESEKLFHQLCARGLSLILILGVWYLAYRVVRGDFSKKELLTFGGFFLGFSLLHLFFFPESFVVMEWDNIVAYSYAIRNIPFYWHNALTTIYYAACFYLFPLPLTIQELSIAAFSALIVFCIYRLERTRFFTLFLLVVPEAWALISRPYRNNMYTLVLLWTTVLVLYLWEKKAVPSRICSLGLIFLLAILAVWRSEGILFSLVLLFFFLILRWNSSLPRLLGWAALWAALVVALGIPQKIGTQKYYGSDYTIVTTMSWLQPVLNWQEANLSYPGASEDLAAIAAITPLDWIREGGMGGYRAYNFSQGRDINQSMADAQTRSDYTKAAFRLVLHNLEPFIRDRINLFLQGNGIGFKLKLDEYAGQPNPFPEDTYAPYIESLDQGQRELYIESNPLVQRWYYSSLRSTVRDQLDSLAASWQQFSNLIDLRLFAYTFSLAYPLLWIFRQLKLLRQGRRMLAEHWDTALLCLIGAGELGLVTLGAPEPRDVYYYPVYFFLTLLMLRTLEGRFLQWRKERKLTHG